MMRNNILSDITTTCMAAVEGTPEFTETRAKLEEYNAKVNARMGFAFSNELDRVVWDLICTMGHEMFVYGWQTRDNPNKLFELPDQQI